MKELKNENQTSNVNKSASQSFQTSPNQTLEMN